MGTSLEVRREDSKAARDAAGRAEAVSVVVSVQPVRRRPSSSRPVCGPGRQTSAYGGGRRSRKLVMRRFADGSPPGGSSFTGSCLRASNW